MNTENWKEMSNFQKPNRRQIYIICSQRSKQHRILRGKYTRQHCGILI
jgi:hypothetical protein